MSISKILANIICREIKKLDLINQIYKSEEERVVARITFSLQRSEAKAFASKLYIYLYKTDCCNIWTELLIPNESSILEKYLDICGMKNIYGLEIWENNIYRIIEAHKNALVCLESYSSRSSWIDIIPVSAQLKIELSREENEE